MADGNNDLTIDSLQIEIASSSAKAEQSIDRLCASLSGLNIPLKKIGNNVGNVRNVMKALSGLDRLKLPDLSKTINQLDALSRIDLKNLQDKKLNLSLEISGFGEAERLKYAVEKTASDIHTITNDIAKDLASTYGLKGTDASKLETMLAKMGKNIARDESRMGDLSDTEDVFKFIIENGKVARKSFDESITGMKDVYRDFLAYVNQNKIKLTDAVDTRNFNESTTRTERQLFFNQKTGKNIDTIWEDMVNNFPGIMMNIRDIINEEDQVFALLEKIRFAKDELATKTISLFDPEEISKIRTNVFNSVNDAYVKAIDGVNSTIASNMQKSAKSIPLDLRIDPSRFEVQIERAIKEAAKKDYGAVNVKLGVDTSQLKKELRDSFEGLQIKDIVQVSKDVDVLRSSLENMQGVDLKTGGVTSFISAFARLSTESKNFDINAFDELFQRLDKISQIKPESVEIFKSIASFLRSTQKLSETAKVFPQLAIEVQSFFDYLSNITISDNVAQTASALAQISTSGKRAGTSIEAFKNQVNNSNSTIKNSKQILRTLGDSLKTLASLFKKLTNAIANTYGNTLKTLISLFKKLSTVASDTYKGILSGTSKIAKSIGSSAVNAIKKLSDSITGLSKSKSSIDSVHFSLKSLLTTVLGFRGITGVFNWAKEALTLGGDITEIDHIVQSVFGENMAGYIEEWSENAIKQFGIAKGAAKQYAGTLNAMFKASNITSDASSVMAIKMVELAGDLSAFYNIDTADAYQKIQSGLAGMVRPLRDLGIDLSVASLKEYALAKGITESYTEMTQAEKVMLRYQYLLDATQLQQGDFAKTSGSLANQIRILKANLQAVTTQLGVGFAAAVRHIVILLNKLLEKVLIVAKAFSAFMQTLFGKYEGGAGGFTFEDYGMDEAKDNMDTLSDSAGGVADGLTDADEATKKLAKDLSVLPFDELNQLSKDIENTKDDSKSKTPSSETYTPNLGNFDDMMADMFDLDFGNLESPLAKLEDYISEWAKRIKEQFDKKNWDGLGREVAKGINDFIDYLLGIFDPTKAKEKIGYWIDAFAEAFNGLIDELNFEGMGTLIGRGIDVLVSSINRLVESIDWKRLGEQLANGANGLIEAIPFDELGKLFANKLNMIWQIAEGFVTTFDWANLGRKLAEGANAFVEQMNLESLANAVATGLNGIADAVLEFVNKFDWRGLGAKFAQGANDLLDKIDFKKIAKAMADGLNGIASAVDEFILKFPWAELGEKLADWANELLRNTDFYLLGKTVADGLNGIITAVSSFIDKFEWDLLGSKLADWANGLIDNIDFILLADTIASGLNGIADTVYTFANKFKWAEAGKKLAEGANQLISQIDIESISQALGVMLNGLYMTANTFVSNFNWAELGSMFARGINSIIDTVDFNLIASTVYTGLNGIINAITSFFNDLDVVTAGNRLGTAFSNIINGVEWKDLGIALAEIWNKAWSFLSEFISNLGVNDVHVEGLYSFNNISQSDVDKTLKKGTGIGQALHDTLKGIIESVKIDDMQDSINTLVQKIAQDISIAFGDTTLWYKIGHTIGEGISGILGNKDTVAEASNAINAIADALYLLFAGAFDALKEHKEDIRGNIIQFLTDLPWDAVMGTMATILVAKIAAKIPIIIGAVLIKNALVNSVTTALKGAAEEESIATAGSGLFKGIIDAAENLKTKLTTVLPEAIATFKTALEDLGTKLSGIVEILGTEGAAGTLLGAIAIASQKIAELYDLMRGGNGVLSEFGGAVDSLGNELAGVNKITPEVRDEIFKLKEEVENDSLTAEEFGEKLVKALQDSGVTAEEARGIIESLGERLGGLNENQVQTLLDLISEMPETAGASKDALSDLGISGEEAFNGIRRGITDAGAEFGAQGLAISQTLAGNIEDAQRFGSDVGVALEEVKTKWEEQGLSVETLREKIDTYLGEGAFDSLIRGSQNISEVGTQLDNTSSKVENYGNTVKSAGEIAEEATKHSAAYNETTSKSPGILESLKPLLSAFGTSLLNSLGEASKYHDTMTSNVESGGQGIEDSRDRLITPMETLVGDALTPFEEAGDKMKDFGESTVEGFGSGVTDNSDKATDPVKDFLEKAISITQDLLDSHSPSKVYEDFGESVPEGFANGLTNKESIINDSIEKLMDSVSSKFTELLSALKSTLEEEGTVIIEKLVSGIQSKEDELNQVIDNVKDAFDTLITSVSDISNSVYEQGAEITGKLAEGMDSRKTDLDRVFTDITNTLEEFTYLISQFRESVEEEARGISSGIVDGLNDGIYDISYILESISSEFNALASDLSSLSYEFEGIGRDLMNSLQYGINSIDLRMPHIDVNWDTYTYGDGRWFDLPSFSVSWWAKGGLFTDPSIIGVGEAGDEAVLPLKNRRTMGMIADAIVSNSSGIGLDEKSLVDAIAQGYVRAMMANQDNQRQPIINVVCKTENDEVLFRAVERGRESVQYRNNPTLQYGF